MRQQLDRDEVSLVIDAAPEVLYDLVADVTLTPKLSPEVVSCRWLDGATGPAVGVRFEATNKVGRGPAWKNFPVVTAAVPGREFAFTVVLGDRRNAVALPAGAVGGRHPGYGVV